MGTVVFIGCREALEENELMNLLRTYRPALERLAIVGALFCVTIGSAFAASVTLNNTTNQLANAIQQAGPGGTVYLQGTIKEEHSVTIPYTITLRGNGPSSTTLMILPDNLLNGLVVLGDNVKISLLRIVPWNTALGNQGTALYISGQACRVQQSQLEGWRIGCFLTGSASQVWVASNTFIASPLNQNDSGLGAGFYSQFAVDTVFLAQNNFSGYHVAAYIAFGSDHRMSSNVATNSGIGFWMSGAVRSQIAGNRVSGSKEAGIRLDDGATGVAVYQNGISGSAGASILADADTSGNRIYNNKVDKAVKDLGNNNVYNNVN
jgi:nitrous oxidase accessory protein NosD